jgi:hypothetical protein
VICTAVLNGWDPATPLFPFPLIRTHIRGLYWSAKIDDIALCSPLYSPMAMMVTPKNIGTGFAIVTSRKMTREEMM